MGAGIVDPLPGFGWRQSLASLRKVQDDKIGRWVVAEEYLDSRRARRVVAGTWFRILSRAVALILALGVFLLWGFAQDSAAPKHHSTTSSPARTHHKKSKPEPPLILEPSPQPAPPPTPPPTLTPEQMPPRVPEVVWDGSLLTIDAVNSTLSDILVAVRTRTGANMDLPPGAASERMAARLGPAPIREVLTSLLSGTSYDYIIQASDTNENEIASVILTPRGKDDALANTSLAASNSGSGVIRRAPGYTASGKHTFEAIPDPPSESAASTDVATTREVDSAQPATTPGGEIDTAGEQGSADISAEPDSNSTAPATLANSDYRPASQNVQTGGGSVPGTAFGQMVQNMQDMFQQRRQIQMQQNQTQQNQMPAPHN